MFKLEKEKKLKRGYKKVNNNKVSEILDDLYKYPFMVAYTGHVDEIVKKRAKDAGFELVIQNPLSGPMVKDLIVSELNKRNDRNQGF